MDGEVGIGELLSLHCVGYCYRYPGGIRHGILLLVCIVNHFAAANGMSSGQYEPAQKLNAFALRDNPRWTIQIPLASE